MANTEVERHTGVDVEDVPSAEWGWSKENYRVIHIGDSGVTVHQHATPSVEYISFHQRPRWQTSISK